jgi:Protein of unknown function (DUF1566)
MRLRFTGSLCALLLAITAYASAAPPSNQTTSGTDTQNWDRIVSGPARFTVLADFNNEAVRDNETGLVWERVPEPNLWQWKDALQRCVIKRIGGRTGWRLPSLFELASLADTSAVQVAPGQPVPGGSLWLTPGHPFIGIDYAPNNYTSHYYWSSTANANDALSAFWMDFGIGVGNGGKAGSGHVWCVRGPGGLSVY